MARSKNAALETALLSLLAPGPRTIKRLRRRLNRTQSKPTSVRTCYRYVDALEASGWVMKIEQTAAAGAASWIVLTPAGAAELRRRTQRASMPEPNIPALYLLPTRIHRLAGGLMILSAIARQEGTPFLANHLSYVLVGGSQKFKTTTAIIVSIILGGDPARDLVLVGDCTESNLLYVSDKGKRAPRALLSAPIGIFDEYLDAESGVLKRLLSLLQGRPELSLSGNVESDRLRIGCVPVLACNPREGTRLSERTGVRDPILSRCVAIDLTNVALPKGLRGKSNELIARAKAMGPMALPALRTLDEPKRLDLVPDAVDAVLDPGAEGAASKLVNSETVSQLVQAARSLLASDRDALAYVLFALGELWELLSWTKPAWRDELARVIGVEVGAPDPESGTHDGTEDTDEAEESSGAIPFTMSSKESALLAEWTQATRKATRLGLTPADLERLAILEAERRDKGSSLAKAASFEDARLAMGLSAADGRAAMKLARDMAELQVPLSELAAVGREVAKSATGEGLGRVHALVEAHGSLEESLAAAEERTARVKAHMNETVKDHKRLTEFFAELRLAKEWLCRDATMRPLYNRLERHLSDKVRTFADRHSAWEAQEEATRLFHWLVTLRAVVDQLRGDPLCAGVVNAVNDIINAENFEKLREMGYLPA